MKTKKVTKLWKGQYSLKEFTDLKNFKTYEELSTRLSTVLNKVSRPVRTTEEDEEILPINSPVVKVDPEPAKTSGFGAKIEELEGAEDSPALSYFASLASED